MLDGEAHGMTDQPIPELRESRVSFPGPFQHHRVVVNGWRVPFLDAHPKGEDRVMLTLDGRLGAEFSVAEAERVVPFLADAISVALGFGCHPREGMDASPVLPHVGPRRLSALTGASDYPVAR